MRAWQLTELGDPWDNLRAADVDSPEPREGQALIAVEGADLNFADILQCQGQYQVKIEVPFVPGMSAAGRVVATGADSGLTVGQRVVGSTTGRWGAFAQQAIVAGGDVYVLPDDVDGAVAAGLHVTYGTSWFALHRRGRLAPGESVLVLAGAGGVGSSAIQMAKAHGCWVLAAAGGAKKVQVCSDLGADVAIDYSRGGNQGESDEGLYEAVMEATSGRGVDVVYDPVGGEYFDIARRLVAWEGRLLVVGFASGTIPSAPANHLLVKNYSVVGVHMGGYRAMDPAVVTECYDEVYAMLGRGEIDPLISERLDFDGLPAGLQRLAERRTTGRLVMDLGRS